MSLYTCPGTRVTWSRLCHRKRPFSASFSWCQHCCILYITFICTNTSNVTSQTMWVSSLHWTVNLFISLYKLYFNVYVTVGIVLTCYNHFLKKKKTQPPSGVWKQQKSITMISLIYYYCKYDVFTYMKMTSVARPIKTAVEIKFWCYA